MVDRPTGICWLTIEENDCFAPVVPVSWTGKKHRASISGNLDNRAGEGVESGEDRGSFWNPESRFTLRFVIMTTLKIPTNVLQNQLPDILCEVSKSNDPIQIVDEQYPAVLLSAANWQSIQETLYLLSIPGMRESIREGLNTPLSDCSETFG